MHPARIADLLDPYLTACHSDPARRVGEESAFLSAAQLEKISAYLDLLLRWNARINLTAIRNEEGIVNRHFGESLFAAQHLLPKVHPVSSSVSSVPPVLKDFDLANDPRPGTNDVGAEARSPKPSLRAADLGSGAGFPGIPIKLWAPEIHMTLIESSQKKSAFLREVVRSLALTEIAVQNARAESLADTFDLVTLRAVERFDSILPIAARLAAPKGRLALLIGASQVEAAQSTLPDFTWRQPVPIPQSLNRVLLTGTK
jgi:16S rRNA (guanine527-N7)-methyltransferase